MKYFLTGGAGFIGSHLATALINRGDEVVIYDDLSTGTLANLSHIINNQNLTFIEGNILDLKLLEQHVVNCDHILHFAAAVGVFNIIEKPLQSLLTNLNGTQNLLELAHKYSIPFFLASTSEVYGKNNQVPLHENSTRLLGSPLKARWSYSEAKAIDESLASFYYQETGLEVRIARLFNTVGPRQVGHYGMVVPRFIHAALKGDPIYVYGQGHQTRCFCNVSDAISAITLLIDDEESIGEVFNIGNYQEISILDLAKKIIHITNSHSTIKFIPYEKAYGSGFEETFRRVPDISKIQSTFGWKPLVTLDETIQEISEYLVKFNSHSSPNNNSFHKEN